MIFKKTLSCLIALLVTVAAIAQDKIYKKNGEIIEAHVSTVNNDYIIYKRANNPDGPEYTVLKTDVSKIRYSNGSEDFFDEGEDHFDRRRQVRSDVYINRNILAFAPIVINENGFGAGLSYERILDRAGWVSFYLPVVTTFRPVENDFGDYTRLDPMIYIMPGVKIYTDVGTWKRSRFSIGPSLVFAAGRRTKDEYYNYLHHYTDQTHFLVGSIVNLGFNIFPTHYLYLGGDAGLGIAYFDEYNNVNKGINVLAQLSFKVGYRF